MPYDVVVVGAGVVGAAIARRLSLDDVRVLWLEARHDVCEGASKANSGITASGYDVDPGTLEAELILASSPRWEKLCIELDVPFRRCGSLALAFGDEDEERLEHARAQAEANGVAVRMLTGSEARAVESTASPEATAALHVPGEGIVDPIRLTIAYAEVAVRNGVELRLSTPALGFEHDGDGSIEGVRTRQGVVPCRFAVNAAGLFADELSQAAGAEEFRMWPRRGQFLLVDRAVGDRVRTVLTPVPTERTRGILAIPTTNRTLLLGPTAEDRENRDDRSTDQETLDKVFAAATRLVPGLGIERRHIIKTFAGLRPAADRTYRVERSERVPNLVHTAGIRSTGISSSPALGERVRGLLAEAGLESRPRRGAVQRLRRVARLAELDADAAARLVDSDERYRVVVCACEHVSAGEIREALSSPVPATSLDAVRKRTRAAAGRCQGAYCSAGIGFLLSLANGLAPWAVPQGEPGSQWGIGEA
jgi:glycerol-3-phosphate dehydrogenase